MVSKYEVRAKKELEAEGWRVDDKRGMSRWSKNRDFFNLWDLVAVKKGEALRWISIKGTMGAIESHREEIRSFWLPENNVKEIWWWSDSKKNKGWRKVVIPNNSD
ncbi:hypothetical protein HYT51_02740 [Candidatus Woesearchaeota archaeon]|nr:hypothetical protein [Candidatus Woesearchaeota archaeon]